MGKKYLFMSKLQRYMQNYAKISNFIPHFTGNTCGNLFMLGLKLIYVSWKWAPNLPFVYPMVHGNSQSWNVFIQSRFSWRYHAWFPAHHGQAERLFTWPCLTLFTWLICKFCCVFFFSWQTSHLFTLPVNKHHYPSLHIDLIVAMAFSHYALL